MRGDDGDKSSVPWARYAFHNVYNYTMLAGVASASLLTQNWWLAVLGGGLEVMWMVFAPDSTLLQKSWFTGMHAEATERLATQMWAAKVDSLPDALRRRVQQLQRLHGQILKMGSENQAVAGDLLRGELDKLQMILLAYADLAQSCDRLEQYLHGVDMAELEGEMQRAQQQVERPTHAEQRAIAQKNIAILSKRRAKLEEIKQFIARAHGQMELIENTFELLADQVVTMRSPSEFTSQLDDLVDGVEAVRLTARETNALLEPAR